MSAVGVVSTPVSIGLTAASWKAAGKVVKTPRFEKMVAKEIARLGIKGVNANIINAKNIGEVLISGVGSYNPVMRTIATTPKEVYFLHELGHATTYGESAFRRATIASARGIPVALFGITTFGSYLYNSRILKKKQRGEKLTPTQKSMYKFTKYVEQNPIKVSLACYSPTLLDEGFASGKALYRIAQKYGPFSRRMGRAGLSLGSAGATYALTAAAIGIGSKVFYDHFRKTSKYRFDDENKMKKYISPYYANILEKFVRSVGGRKYVVVSHKGKRLSKPSSKAKAQKRLRQIEYFKGKG